MAFPIGPTNGDDITNVSAEVIGVEDGQFGRDGQPIGADPLQQKNLLGKIAEMELENKRLHAELDRHKLIAQFTQLQSDQKAILGRISELEKDEKWAKAMFAEKSPSKELRRKRNGNGELMDQMETMAPSNGFGGRIAELEMALKNKDLEIRALQAEMREQKLLHNALQGKVAKMEQEQQQNNNKNKGEGVSVDQTQNMAQEKNCWDANVCNDALSIIRPKCLVVHQKGKNGFLHSVVAKHSILYTDSPNFYFEVKVEKMTFITFGLTVKEMPFGKWIEKFDWDERPYRYAYYSAGALSIDSPNRRGKKEAPQFYVGDVVGCGVNLANRQIIFTKNGQRLDITDLFISPSSPINSLFPFVSLTEIGDQIEANFGPHFQCDVGTLF